MLCVEAESLVIRTGKQHHSALVSLGEALCDVPDSRHLFSTHIVGQVGRRNGDRKKGAGRM